MDWLDLRHRYMSMLSDMGFRPEVDSDGDIHFRYEGGNYYITSNCDDTYFFLLFPGFWTLDSKAEQLAGLLAANNASRRVKAAKTYVTPNMDRVSVSLECLIGGPSDVRSFLMRGLRCIQQSVTVFKAELRSMVE